jgi:hypothetical protein
MQPDLSTAIHNILILIALIGGITLISVIGWYVYKTYNLYKAHLESRFGQLENIQDKLQDSINTVSTSTEAILAFVESSKEESRKLRQLIFQTQAWMRKAEREHFTHILRTEKNELDIKCVDNRVTSLDTKVEKLVKKIDIQE